MCIDKICIRLTIMFRCLYYTVIDGSSVHVSDPRGIFNVFTENVGVH